MANMPDGRPAYEGKELSPGNQLSQGRQTAIRANNVDLPTNSVPTQDWPVIGDGGAMVERDDD